MNKQEMLQFLQEEKTRMRNCCRIVKRRLGKAPEGSLRIVKHGKGYQCYHKKKSSRVNGEYIRSSEKNLIKLLIQKAYDQKVLPAAEKQYAAIHHFLEHYDADAFVRIYENTTEIRKESIDPIELPDSDFRKRWEAVPFIPKEMDKNIPEHYTGKGERVRSKSEVMIADALAQAGIAYRYECPLVLDGKTMHPDFTILRMSDRKEIYWEHLGMMDREDYCQSAILRIRFYESNGLCLGRNFILTFETSELPINHAVIGRAIRSYCL